MQLHGGLLATTSSTPRLTQRGRAAEELSVLALLEKVQGESVSTLMTRANKIETDLPK